MAQSAAVLRIIGVQAGGHEGTAVHRPVVGFRRWLRAGAVTVWRVVDVALAVRVGSEDSRPEPSPVSAAGVCIPLALAAERGACALEVHDVIRAPAAAAVYQHRAGREASIRARGWRSQRHRPFTPAS